MLGDPAQQERQHSSDAIGEAMLAAHQLRAKAERLLSTSDAVLTREEIATMTAELREPQHRIVQAMTRLLGLVPSDFEDELLLGDAQVVRDVALRLGSDDVAVAAGEPGLRTSSALAAFVSGTDAAGRGPPVILVVDDSAETRDVLKKLLTQLGYDVITAADGLQALAATAVSVIDVILTDIEMPECDGFELLQRLKADENTRDIPVVVVSGLGDDSSVVRCIELGADDHLSKPFRSLVLRARLRASLDRKRLRDQELAYLRRVAQLTLAAEEVESASYRAGSLGELAAKDDALGRLARVFDRVATGWQAREARLKRRVRQFQEEIRHSKSRSSFELQLLPGFAPDVAGQLFANRFEIIEELGRGGMGVVYRARDRELGEEIAIKVMRSEMLKEDPALVDRLKMEIRLARRITHPNVVRAHDFGEFEGSYFLTMECISGTTVERLLEANGRLSVASTLAVGTQLAEALAVAHEQQIIHRDIKPANLLVDDAGLVKVTDFGLARTLEVDPQITQRGSIVGTPLYMSPEQLFGHALDERSDLYSAGAVLYECLTGAPPHDANSPTEIVARMVDGPPVRVDTLVPTVSSALADLIAQLLMFESRDRVQSARELTERLREMA